MGRIPRFYLTLLSQLRTYYGSLRFARLPLYRSESGHISLSDIHGRRCHDGFRSPSFKSQEPDPRRCSPARRFCRVLRSHTLRLYRTSGCINRNNRRSRRTYRYLSHHKACSGTSGADSYSSIFIYGPDTAYPAAADETLHDRGDEKSQDGTDQGSFQDGKDSLSHCRLHLRYTSSPLDSSAGRMSYARKPLP